MEMRPQIGPAGQGRPLIVTLEHVDAGGLPLVGGKAASLGELIAAGLPVPAGLCVTTEAYRDVAAAAGLAEILDRLAATPTGETGALAGLARQARADPGHGHARRGRRRGRGGVPGAR
jgi:phosphoenolpyruvate synthase/pyruvate phosphate dikinase